MGWSRMLRDLPTFLRMRSAQRRFVPGGRETLATLLRARASTAPRGGGFRHGDEFLDPAGFVAAGGAFAAVLGSAGVGRGESVGLVMGNSLVLLAAEAAVAQTGTLGVLVDPRCGPAALGQALRSSRVRHVFTDAASLPALLELPDAVTYTIWSRGEASVLPPHVEPLDAALASAAGEQGATAAVRGGDPFLRLFTATTRGGSSVSTVTHAGFLSAGAVLSGVVDAVPEDVICAPIPLHTPVAQFLGLGLAAQTGATLTLGDGAEAGAPWPALRRHAATALLYTGDLCAGWLRSSGPSGESVAPLRWAVGTGLGAADWPRLAARINAGRHVEFYGTGAGRVLLVNRDGLPGSVGRPLPFRGGDLRLARCAPAGGELLRGTDGRLAECEPGEDGELLVRVTSGDEPGKGRQDQSFVQDAFRRGDLYLRTGDLFRRDAASNFYLAPTPASSDRPLP